MEGDTTVIVMHDLGNKVLTWASSLSTDETDWMLARVAAMHRRFLGDPPREVAPLDKVLTVFAPERIRGLADQGNELAGLARAPELTAFLPGLWAVLFGLGVVAARPHLPPATGMVGL